VNLRYAHFRNCDKGRSYTVAYTIEPEGDNFNVRFGIAVCAPGDAFVKAKGRMIAAGRWDKRYEILHSETGDNKAVLAMLRRVVDPTTYWGYVREYASNYNHLNDYDADLALST
jgi:hypothetical protein